MARAVYSLGVALALGVVLASPGASEAAPATLLSPLEPTGVSSYGGKLVFSRFEGDANRFEDGFYRLVERHGEGVRPLPVRPRTVPFDVDLGPDARGRTVAVYSRCRTDPVNLSISGLLPAYRSGRGCRLYRFDFSTRRERVIRGLGRRPSSFLPTIWRSRLAWAESTDPGVTGREPPPRLMLKEGTRPPRRLRGGTGPNRGVGLPPEPGPVVLDLRGDRLTFTWAYSPSRSECAGTGKPAPDQNSEVWLHRFGHSRKRIAHAGCPEDGGVRRLEWSTLSAGALTYLRSEGRR